jgi:hypothetical protein
MSSGNFSITFAANGGLSEKLQLCRAQGDGERFSTVADSPADKCAAFQSIAIRILARPLG